ncbi:MAG: leucyl/phenylalanyl-tRNA--protein transferase [Woeseia sp.]
MTTPRIAWISQDDPPDAFPEISSALTIPDGLLAAGGDLSRDRLLHAYRRGVFPWFDSGQPILWWTPDPRCVMEPASFHVARRLCRSVRSSPWKFSFNEDFAAVIRACAAARVGQQGTWITEEMVDAFSILHAESWAHSVEVWRGTALIGGLYGLVIGKAFFGESMFSRESNASKIAMWALCTLLVRHEFAVLDCQVASPHLTSLGAILMPRSEFGALLERACDPALPFGEWPQSRIPVAELLGSWRHPALQ